jgi:hypothetical protein
MEKEERAMKRLLIIIVILLSFLIPLLSYAAGYKVFPKIGMTKSEVLFETQLQEIKINKVITVMENYTGEGWSVFKIKDIWSTTCPLGSKCQMWSFVFVNEKLHSYSITYNSN